MAAPAKFLFDLDFGAPDGARKPTATVSTAAHEAALAEAETRGYHNGLAAAESRARMEEAQAKAEAERRIAMAFEQIAAGLQRMQQALDGLESRFEAEAVEVAVAVARKLAPALIEQQPMAEIAALADGCFRELMAAPHVVVRVNDSLYARAKESLEDIARNRGFEGRLVVLGVSDVAIGDCRIEWADGGLVRDRAVTEAAIADAVDRYVAVRRAGAGH